jgi:hypothetical protein
LTAVEISKLLSVNLDILFHCGSVRKATRAKAVDASGFCILSEKFCQEEAFIQTTNILTNEPVT